MAKATKKTAKKEVEKVEPVKEETHESNQEPTQSSESSTAPEVKTETSIESNTETNGNTETATQEDPVVKEKPLKIVIPYLKKAASGSELKYALRSIYASFPDAVIVIVGDKEDWFSEEIIHLEHTPESDNPQIDVAHKLLLVLASGVVDDHFILSNDDIFLLGKTTIEDIYVHKSFGELNAGVGQKDGRYNKNAANSQKQLLANNLSIHRYGTHTPVALYSEELAETLEQYKADEEGHLITSLYFNTHYPEARPIQINGGKHDSILVSVYRADAPVEVLEEALAKRKFCNVNDAGWKAVEPYLAKMYPNKSKWEA